MIKICDMCGGFGKINLSIDSRLDNNFVTCEKCNGSGKVYSLDVNFELTTPFDKGEVKIIQLQHKIYEFIRSESKKLK